MGKRIIITAGGTGGHIFPAIALGKQLMAADGSLELLYVGGNLDINPYFDKDLFRYQAISCATFINKSPWETLKASYKILKGIKQSCKIINDYRPDMVVGFGSYYTLPMLLAAKAKEIPFILHEANSVPGKVNRCLAKYASFVGIHFPDTASLLVGKTYEVGMPLRPEYHKGGNSSAKAHEFFGLEKERDTILAFGGSQGALNLNNLVSEALIQHLKHAKEQWQIVHLTGDASSSQFLKEEYRKAGIKACVKPFETHMELAWQAADISITRAGAGSIAEQLEFEVPGILIPYPYATDNHQEKNAAFLVEKVGGALRCQEKELNAFHLAGDIESFTLEKRKKMSQAMHNYKINHRPKEFYKLILEALHV
jgi:UDP-N-acetylglucosamine--N-acetylmuramyl-(pentapeptide) pyrophosphoryl-undecaprenol N-acetylglucosamine transferase